jgi:hypothetical protein
MSDIWCVCRENVMETTFDVAAVNLDQSLALSSSRRAGLRNEKSPTAR